MPTDLARWIKIKVEIIKGGMVKYGVTNPIFSPPSIHISTTT